MLTPWNLHDDGPYPIDEIDAAYVDAYFALPLSARLDAYAKATDHERGLIAVAIAANDAAVGIAVAAIVEAAKGRMAA